MLVVVGLLGVILLNAGGEPDPRSVMPDDFNYSESKQAVEDFYGVPCESTLNNSYTKEYEFECSQTRGNYSYVASATVEYNETGPDEVHIYR